MRKTLGERVSKRVEGKNIKGNLQALKARRHSSNDRLQLHQKDSTLYVISYAGFIYATFTLIFEGSYIKIFVGLPPLVSWVAKEVDEGMFYPGDVAIFLKYTTLFRISNL
ncbi:uncharacterized protein BX664DRAFT_315956 [Halteromyces radiatus]|uniref:uncharacterized protein n=1 Tax=Halteromyces radiatus TaxID=101107 RepID=UPI0022205DFA|nr:uncharacterized protein BX664DRAFT_315956 [Halteromyces radiatus]KAI8086790.1 hypothetical protein BX664DRAFT_315956 [Halteromyces radiatus]